jgi:predicted GNAT family N-acyltransferase
MAVEIIRFTFNDTSFIEKAFEIRRVVFVIEQDCPPELEYENEEICQHYLAFMTVHPPPTARWRTTDKGIKLERFAVLNEFRRKGLALSLVNRLLELMFVILEDKYTCMPRLKQCLYTQKLVL